MSSFSRPSEQPRAKSCSIALQSNAFSVSLVWNEKDTRFAFGRRELRPRQTHNDWKLPATNKWQSQRLRIVQNSVAPALSCSISTRESFRSQSSTCCQRSNVFFCINDWPNGGGDYFRRHGFTRTIRCRTDLAELRLLNPRCHQHRNEEQRRCEIIWCAGQLK